jgi:hypothetical protein
LGNRAEDAVAVDEDDLEADSSSLDPLLLAAIEVFLWEATAAVLAFAWKLASSAETGVEEEASCSATGEARLLSGVNPVAGRITGLCKRLWGSALRNDMAEEA